jgi:glycoside/pentoside/hexuronide:cation symporter, GPH family
MDYGNASISSGNRLGQRGCEMSFHCSLKLYRPALSIESFNPKVLRVLKLRLDLSRFKIHDSQVFRLSDFGKDFLTTLRDHLSLRQYIEPSLRLLQSPTPMTSPNLPTLLKPMNFSTKLAYGAGDLGPAITANILSFFQAIFLTNVAGIDPGKAAIILLVGKIWDAINDPIVGMMSDRTRSKRWGRRYPWMLWGAVPFGITFFLQWTIPNLGDWGLCLYYVAVNILFNTFYTMVNLPYTALTPELTQDYNERTSLNSFRFAFSIGGSLLSLALALLTFKFFTFADVPNPYLLLTGISQKYLVLTGLCAVLATFPLYWCIFGTRQRSRTVAQHNLRNSEPAPLPFLSQIKIAFSNRPFLFVIGIYLCSWLGVQITSAILPYFVGSWLGQSTETFIQITMVVQVTALIMLFVWSKISVRIGKKAVYFMGMGVWIIAQAGLFFLKPDQIYLVYPLAIMAGVGVATAYLIPWSMMPDVIELDELNTGQRREGVFYGFMVLLQKVGLAIGIALVLKALDVAGYIESTTGTTPVQPDSALFAIRLAIGPIPTIALILGLVLAYFYPITREVHAEILLKLQERKAASNPEE